MRDDTRFEIVPEDAEWRDAQHEQPTVVRQPKRAPGAGHSQKVPVREE
jgi:hypothetical protein